MRSLIVATLGASLLAGAVVAGPAQPTKGVIVNSVRIVDVDQEKFADAIERDRADVVQELLKAGFSPNVVVEDNDPALVRAIRMQNEDVLEVLLAYPKIDVNMSSDYGETAIMLAAFSGDIKLVKRLLAMGASIRKVSGWTALHYAATKGHEDIVKLLLENGAGVNIRTSAGITPLYMAAREGQRKIVMQLLRAGAYRDLCNFKGQSPADAAREFGDAELAKYLAVERCIEPPDSPFAKVPKAKR